MNDAFIFILVVIFFVSVIGNPVKQPSSKNEHRLHPQIPSSSVRNSNVSRSNDADKAKGQLSPGGRPVYSFSVLKQIRGGGEQRPNYAAFKASFRSKTANNSQFPISNALQQEKSSRLQVSPQSVSKNAQGNNKSVENAHNTNTTNRGKSFSNFKRLQVGLNAKISASARPGHIEIWNLHNSFPGMNLTPEQNKRIFIKLNSMRRENIIANNTSMGVDSQGKSVQVNFKPPVKSNGEKESKNELSPKAKIIPQSSTFYSVNLTKTILSNDVSYNTLSVAPTKKNAKYMKTEKTVNTAESPTSNYNDPGKERWKLLNSNSNSINNMGGNGEAMDRSSAKGAGSNKTALEYRKKSNLLSVVESRKRFRSLYTVKVKASDFNIKKNDVNKTKIDNENVHSNISEYGNLSANSTKYLSANKGKNLRKQIIEATDKIKALKQSIIKSKKNGNFKNSMGNIEKRLKDTLTKVKTLQSQLKGKRSQLVNGKTKNISLSGRTKIKTDKPSKFKTNGAKVDKVKQNKIPVVKMNLKNNKPKSTEKQNAENGKSVNKAVLSSKAEIDGLKLKGVISSQPDQESKVNRYTNIKNIPSKPVMSKMNLNKFSYKTKSNAVQTRKENDVYINSIRPSFSSRKTNKQVLTAAKIPNKPVLQRTVKNNRKTTDSNKDQSRLTKNRVETKINNNLESFSSDGNKSSLPDSINRRDKFVITNVLSSTSNKINIPGKSISVLTKNNNNEITNKDRVKGQLTTRNDNKKDNNDNKKVTNYQTNKVEHGKTNDPKDIYNKRLFSPFSALGEGQQSGNMAERTLRYKTGDFKKTSVGGIKGLQASQQQILDGNVRAQASKKTESLARSRQGSHKKGASKNGAILRHDTLPSQIGNRIQNSVTKHYNNAGQKNVLIKPVRSNVNVKTIQRRKLSRANNNLNKASVSNVKFPSLYVTTQQGQESAKSQKFFKNGNIESQKPMTMSVSKLVSSQTQQRSFNARRFTDPMSIRTFDSSPMPSQTHQSGSTGQSLKSQPIVKNSKSNILSRNGQTPFGSAYAQNKNVTTHLQSGPKITSNILTDKNSKQASSQKHASTKSKQTKDQQMTQKASTLIAKSRQSLQISTLAKPNNNRKQQETATKRNGYWYIDRNGQYQWYEIKPTNGLGKNSPDPSYGYYDPPTTQVSAKFGSSAFDYPYYDYQSSKSERKKEEEEES